MTEGQAGDRLDKLVALALPELSRARVQQLVDDGFVRVGGVVVKSAERPKAGLQVEVRLPVVAEPKLTPVQIGLKKLFEDQHLVVIDKPAGLSVHPGAGEPQTTLVHGLLAEIADLAGIGGELRPGIVHRLDKDTSGCLVVAKSEPVLRGLQEQFAGRKVDKRYLAIVHGVAAPQGTFDTLHGRHPTDRKRFSTKVNEGKRAVTRWTRLGERAPVKDVDLGASLVTIELLTGRTHQIRAHFADAGHPLLADELYGATRLETKLPEKSLVKQAAAAVGRQALHAHKLSFAHPITGKTIACEAPLPQELTAGLLLLGLPVPA
ncbi:MAG: RluA family pseudouridine synthase [Deltaproteobacteria bacterium]|nr:RluA family pseudouridine synthase [Deltaproteobacteria bacterium]